LHILFYFALKITKVNFDAMGEKTDIEHWKRFIEGDEAAYTTLYSRHVQAMYRYGMSLVPVSEAFVFDCIHDVFTEIWAKRLRLSVPNNVRYYLLRALKIRILHLLQRKEGRTDPISQTDFDNLWAEPSPEEIFTHQEESHNKQELVQKLIAQLPPRQQEALRLRFVEAFDYNEIATTMDMNRQSAQNLVFRAVEKLREWLKITPLSKN
jgi:RNA polymerase sigma factor (sigma-70 family)